MQDEPDAGRILAAVADHLKARARVTVGAGHGGAFEDRVAAAAIDIARREITDAPAMAAAERRRLADLLGTEGSLAALNTELARRIADAAMDLETPGLADHLWQVTLDKVAVDQPRFALYRRLTGAGE